MIELVDIPQKAREQIEQIGAMDLIVAVLGRSDPVALDGVLEGVRESIAKLYSPVRTLMIHSGESLEDSASQDAVRTLAFPLPPIAGDPAQSIGDAYHAVFSVGRNLGARAVVILVSDVESITPHWIYSLARPVLELDFDLVTPCYGHARSQGLLNSSIVAPITRALYGKRIEHPLGPDFGFSGRLVERRLNTTANPRGHSHPRSLASIAVDAICDGLEVCQAHVGVRHYPPTDWMNQSSVLTQILGPLFTEAEFHASQWQRVRGSQAVAAFGETSVSDAEPEAADVRRMIDSFQLGWRNLQEIWSLVLPPGTLLELSKLSKLPAEQFHMPDRLWARIVYDFALGHRLRLLNPDHLLRAMTPLYLAWVASYTLESAIIEPGAVAQRLEVLALAFEAAKPYLVSRWRWPDRFNP